MSSPYFQDSPWVPWKLYWIPGFPVKNLCIPRVSRVYWKNIWVPQVHGKTIWVFKVSWKYVWVPRILCEVPENCMSSQGSLEVMDSRWLSLKIYGISRFSKKYEFPVRPLKNVHMSSPSFLKNYKGSLWIPWKICLFPGFPVSSLKNVWDSQVPCEFPRKIYKLFEFPVDFPWVRSLARLARDPQNKLPLRRVERLYLGLGLEEELLCLDGRYSLPSKWIYLSVMIIKIAFSFS